MGRTSSSNDGFGRGAAPAAGPFSLSKDKFKEKAEQLAALKGQKPARDAFAPKPAERKVSAPEVVETRPPVVREAAFRPDPPHRTWVLANGASLEVVASQPHLAKTEALKQGENQV